MEYKYSDAKSLGIDVNPNATLSKKMALTCETPVRLAGNISMNGSIGAFTYVRPGGRLGGVKAIGRFCSIALDVVIGDGFHSTNWVSTHPFQWGKSPFPKEYFDDIEIPRTEGDSKKSVVIGHDVWLGSGCQIMRGVTVGHGAIIGAGCIVTKDVPPYAIVGGVPGKIIKYRFSEEIIAKLLELQWWRYDPKQMRGVRFNDIDYALGQLEDRINRKFMMPFKPKKYKFEGGFIRAV